MLASLVAVALLGSHFSAVGQCLVPAYGCHGAEYIEHIPRDVLTSRFESFPLFLRILRLPLSIAEADHTYPPLLHVIAALWGSFVGNGIGAVLHLNLLYLLVLGLATGIATRRFSDLLGHGPASVWSSVLAGSTVVLLPAVFGASRRYYYDLPMAAWVTLAFMALCYTPVSVAAALLAAAATAAALLTKWTAGFYLVPLWLFAAVLALRESTWRLRLLAARNIAGAALMVVVLCSPVLVQSATLHHMVPSFFRSIGLEKLPTDIFPTNSFDCAIHQAVVPTESDQGVPSPPPSLGLGVLFYGRGIPRSVVGPLLSLALLVVMIVGLRGWKVLLVASAVCLPAMALFISPIIEPLDERFCLPIVPIAVVGVFAAWDRNQIRPLRIASGGLVVTVGLLQLAAWDGRLALGPKLTGRPSWEERGWSRLDRATCSPDEEYAAFARDACGPEDSRLVVSKESVIHVGIGWLLERECGPIHDAVHPEPDAMEILSEYLAAPDHARPLSLISSRNLESTLGLRPIRSVWLAKTAPPDPEMLFLYRVGGDLASAETCDGVRTAE